jgi:hypothetical protein
MKWRGLPMKEPQKHRGDDLKQHEGELGKKATV